MRWPRRDLLLAAAIVACSRSRPSPDEQSMPAASIEAVLEAHNASLMAMPGVVGTAIGRCDGRPCIRVFVRDSAAAKAARLGSELDGYPMRVEVSGPLYPRSSK